MATWNLEHTDTFGGEANYCWVNRQTIDAANDRQVIRKAKAFAGFTGMRCRVDNFGDTIQITPVGRHRLLQTVFATWADNTADYINYSHEQYEQSAA